jgi:predicted hydrolase (HD superfamily)
MPHPYTPERALELLYEWTKGESLRKHGLAVAACTEAYGRIEAARLGLTGEPSADFAGRYRSAGLLHDMDYERHPSLDEHPFVGVGALRQQGWPEDILHAILAHADYSGTPRHSHLDRALFACDELAGFLTACALVKPSRAIADVEVAAVRKKMKDKAFARAVKREDILDGAALLGISVEDHIANCLQSMQTHAHDLGLAGT